VTYPTNATAHVTVSNKANGTIEIRHNGVLVGNGTIRNGEATVNLTRLVGGEYTVEVDFITNDTYNNNVSTTATFKVYKMTPVINIVAPEIAYVGKDVNITVTTNGYNLTVWINGVNQTIVNGNVTYTVPNNGIITVFAKTTENDTVYAANKTVVFEAVKNNATLIIEEIGIVKVGDKVKINITNITDGELTIKVDGVIVTNGEFTPATSGNYTITVESKETGKYFAGFNSTTFEVIKHNARVNITVNDSYYVGQAFNIGIENDTVVNVTINGKV
jgi:hypothetical protein